MSIPLGPVLQIVPEAFSLPRNDDWVDRGVSL